MHDDTLRALLKKSALQAPPEPWFTKKVMNRLPERAVNLTAWIEYGVYLISALATIVYGVIFGIDTYHSGVITVGDFSVLALLVGLLIAIAWLFISPWLAQAEE